MEAIVVNPESLKEAEAGQFLGYCIKGGDAKITFNKGYDDKSAIRRAQNLAVNMNVRLLKVFKVDGKIVTEVIFPLPKENKRPKA